MSVLIDVLTDGGIGGIGGNGSGGRPGPGQGAGRGRRHNPGRTRRARARLRGRGTAGSRPAPAEVPGGVASEMPEALRVVERVVERKRAARPRKGEVDRPPTRARFVAGRRPHQVADCAPRRVTPKWPWLVALGLAVSAVITGSGLLAARMAPAAVPEHTVTVPVTAGETLDDLARRFAPDSDTGAVVARIERLNGLAGAVLVPGMPVVVPAEAGAVDGADLGAGGDAAAGG